VVSVLCWGTYPPMILIWLLVVVVRAIATCFIGEKGQPSIPMKLANAYGLMRITKSRNVSPV